MTPTTSWNALPPQLQAAALHWAERWQARNTQTPVDPTPGSSSGPPCGPCKQLLDALCTIGPSADHWCDLRTQVITGQVDPAQTMRHIFDTADPQLLLQARTWVHDHG